MVRRAGPADIGSIAETLTRAFHDDPVMSWIFPPGRRHAARLRAFFRGRARALLRQGEVWTVDDHAGAALWAEPGRWRMTVLDTILTGVRFVPSFGRRMPEVLAGLQVVEEFHPREPHWYLAVLGTDPARQGEGLGSELLRPVLEACDEHDVGAYLESSKERNIDFYARFGFRVMDELRMPNGPPVWPMWRGSGLSVPHPRRPDIPGANMWHGKT